MLPRFNKNDMRTVAHYLGILVLIFGAVMLAPLVVSVVCAEWEASYRYILGISIALTTGSVLRLAKIDPQRMSRKHAIAITGMIWIVGAVLAAVPLYLSGHYASFLDTVFEGVSGLTATGLSLVQDVDHMSMADNMWRFTMQFVGGQGVVVVAISLGLFARTGNKLYASEGREESVVPNVMNTARFIWKFALAAVLLGTVVMTVILLLTGMEPARGFFHALWLTIGAYDTGGFAPGSLSLVSYHSWPLEIAAMLLMMIGALNFALVAQIHKGNWREFVQDIEVRTLAL
jgi:trk system potassium uptake protein TrkH